MPPSTVQQHCKMWQIYGFLGFVADTSPQLLIRLWCMWAWLPSTFSVECVWHRHSGRACIYSAELSATTLQNLTDLWILGFCGRHISSTAHSFVVFVVFVGLICFKFLRRMRSTHGQWSGALLTCRTECHNIAKFDRKWWLFLKIMIKKIIIFDWVQKS